MRLGLMTRYRIYGSAEDQIAELGDGGDHNPKTYEPVTGDWEVAAADGAAREGSTVEERAATQNTTHVPRRVQVLPPIVGTVGIPKRAVISVRLALDEDDIFNKANIIAIQAAALAGSVKSSVRHSISQSTNVRPELPGIFPPRFAEGY